MKKTSNNLFFTFFIFTVSMIVFVNITYFPIIKAIAETSVENNEDPNLIKLKGIPLIETTDNDRKEIVLTIYNNNFAFVKEIREINLPDGISELRFWDISKQINPASIMVKSLDSIRRIEFLEQNYEHDLISSQSLMDKYIGYQVKLMDKDDFSGSKGELQAELLSIQQGPIFRIGDEIHIGHPGRIVLPKLPESLTIKPSLLWKLSVTDMGKYPLEVSYLANNLDWQADYSLVLNSDNTRGDLFGWVTIKNDSGTAFQKARVQLVAGKVDRVKEPRLIRMKEADDRTMLSKGISQEEIFEYHLYNLPPDMTLKDKQTKQVRLFSTERIPIKKELRYYGIQQYYNQRFREQEKPQGIGVYLEFENRKTFHLGVPLPEGIVRIYKRDSKDSIQFLGEDRISHTPEDAKVRIQTGYATDLIIERRQMDWRKPSSDLIEAAWEIILRNYKNEASWIVVMESVPGDWEVIESSHHWQKEEAHMLRFDLSVAPKSEEKIRYRVKIHF